MLVRRPTKGWHHVACPRGGEGGRGNERGGVVIDDVQESPRRCRRPGPSEWCRPASNRWAARRGSAATPHHATPGGRRFGGVVGVEQQLQRGQQVASEVPKRLGFMGRGWRRLGVDLVGEVGLADQHGIDLLRAHPKDLAARLPGHRRDVCRRRPARPRLRTRRATDSEARRPVRPGPKVISGWRRARRVRCHSAARTSAQGDHRSGRYGNRGTGSSGEAVLSGEDQD